MTLEEARSNLRENLDTGVRCPCCDQWAQRYRRVFNSGMAMLLVKLCKYTETFNPFEGWFNFSKEMAAVEGLNINDLEYSKLQYWYFIEPHTDSRGMWRVTEEAFRFVREENTIPEAAFVYNNTVNGYAEDYIGIRDALGKKFDLAELLSGTPKK